MYIHEFPPLVQIFLFFLSLLPSDPLYYFPINWEFICNMLSKDYSVFELGIAIFDFSVSLFFSLFSNAWFLC